MPGDVSVHRHLLPSRDGGVHAIVMDPVLSYHSSTAAGRKREKARRKRYAYLVCEFSTQILVWDVIAKRVVHTWDIPWREWGFGSAEDPSVMVQPVAPHNGVFASNEDLYFTMKTPHYKIDDGTDDGGVGQGEIGRLRMPWLFGGGGGGTDSVDFSKEENRGNEWSRLDPDRPRWSVFKMADFASDRHLAANQTQQPMKLPFYIDTWTAPGEGATRAFTRQRYGPGSDLVWFNSITTSEIGCINITVPDRREAFELIFLPDPETLAADGDQQAGLLFGSSEQQAAEIEVIGAHVNPASYGPNLRPGGVVTTRHGTAYVSVYNVHGVLAEVAPRGLVAQLPRQGHGATSSTGISRVVYTPIANFPTAAFLHLSRSESVAQKLGLLGSQHYSMDLILTASSNDFGAPSYVVPAAAAAACAKKIADAGAGAGAGAGAEEQCRAGPGGKIDNPYVPPKQADFVLVLAGVGGGMFGGGGDGDRLLRWGSETVVPASTQGSWLHRSWGLQPTWDGDGGDAGSGPASSGSGSAREQALGQITSSQPGARLYATTELKADRLLLTQMFMTVGRGFASTATATAAEKEKEKEKGEGKGAGVDASEWHAMHHHRGRTCTYENPTRTQEVMPALYDEEVGILVQC
jgi:hypothetical protein